MTELKKGDRVTVEVPPRKTFNGLIVGEGRNGLWWLIVKDGTKSRNGYHKNFCRPESQIHGNHFTQATTAITARLVKNGRLAPRANEMAATRAARTAIVFIGPPARISGSAGRCGRSSKPRYHEMLHHSRSGFLNVMFVIQSRIPDVFRVKRFLKMQVSL